MLTLMLFPRQAAEGWERSVAEGGLQAYRPQGSFVPCTSVVSRDCSALLMTQGRTGAPGAICNLQSPGGGHHMPSICPGPLASFGLAWLLAALGLSVSLHCRDLWLHSPAQGSACCRRCAGTNAAATEHGMGEPGAPVGQSWDLLHVRWEGTEWLQFLERESRLGVGPFSIPIPLQGRPAGAKGWGLAGESGAGGHASCQGNDARGVCS